MCCLGSMSCISAMQDDFVKRFVWLALIVRVQHFDSTMSNTHVPRKLLAAELGFEAITTSISEPQPMKHKFMKENFSGTSSLTKVFLWGVKAESSRSSHQSPAPICLPNLVTWSKSHGFALLPPKSFSSFCKATLSDQPTHLQNSVPPCPKMLNWSCILSPTLLREDWRPNPRWVVLASSKNLLRRREGQYDWNVGFQGSRPRSFTDFL